MDIASLKEALGDEKFAALQSYVNDLTGQRDTARNESITGRKKLKDDLAAAQAARERVTRQAVADRRTYTENLAAVQRGLDRCNAATAAAGAAARVTASRLQEAAQGAQDARETAERRAAALLAGRAGANACQSALDVARSLP